MRVQFHPEALVELEHAAQYYESRRLGLGTRFIDAVQSAAERISETPLAWRVVEDDVRRCLTRVFPYGVLYTVETEAILIVAVAHLAREPGYWKSRL